MKIATLGLLNLMLLAGASAQDGPRDPMQPPAALRPAVAPGGSATAEPAPAVARHLMVIDGVRWVIDGGRRRGVGDLLGGVRIERIEDSAVVVRNGKQLQRLPLFAGVVKTPVAEPRSATAANPTGARPADTLTHPVTDTVTPPVTQTAQALSACVDRPSCMQRPGEPR